MMTSRSFVPLLVLLLIASCTVEDPPKPYQCRIKTATYVNERDIIDVVYEIQIIGKSQVFEWYYYSSNGKTTVRNPVQDTSISLVLGLNDSILSGAYGTVTEGSIRVTFRALTSDTVISSSDACVQSLNAVPTIP